MLPNTWKEFCDNYPLKSTEWFINKDSHIDSISVQEVSIHNKRYINDDRNLLPSAKAAMAHLALMQLHQLRDCYRQGWLPDWDDDNKIKYCITLESNRYVIYENLTSCNFLSFQSKEIAEKFLNNFQELIKIAGDLI